MEPNMTTNYFSPGEVCLQRCVVAGRVWSAQSLRVVEDGPERSLLLLLPGAECALPQGYWHWKLQGDTSQGTRWEEALGPDLRLRRYGWLNNRVLLFLEPGKYYGIFLFWAAPDFTFTRYYVNFQLPFRRTPLGFDTLDLDLDIVIYPDHRWEWKDEEEYRAGIRAGGIRPEWVQGIEDSLPGLFAHMRAHSSPLDDAWIDWQPDPTWTAPHLPDGWQQLDGGAA